MEQEKLIALVTAVQKGDEKAMTEMYETFHDDLYYYIFKTVNDRELAADLTQDAFMEILQSIASLQEPAAFVTWSRQIAYRRCTAWFKKRHDLLADEDEDGYSVFDTVAEDRAEFIPDEALDKEDLKQTIGNIIDSLPQEQRAAIMMRYFDEISVAEIAEIQGVSEGTVKSRLNYGRKSIKNAVEEYEKKNGIKLHCAGVVPLLLWLFRAQRKAAAPSAAAAAATTAAVAAKGTAGALAAKIAAGILAAALAVGGAAAGIAEYRKGKEPPKDEPAESVTDATGEPGECTHSWKSINQFQVRIYDEEWDAWLAGSFDLLCTDCGEMKVMGLAQATDGCDHVWQETQEDSPYAAYTRGYCEKCGRYAILAHTVNPCKHNWEHGDESVCTDCGYVCEHIYGFYMYVDAESEQLRYCNGCGEKMK